MKIKGSGITALTNFVEDRFGEAALEAWIETLSDNQQPVLRSAFASSWYDYVEMYLEPMRLMCEHFFSDNTTEGARALGLSAAETQLTGVYRILLKLGSPNMMISAAGKTWIMLHSAGKLVPVVNEKGNATIRTKDIPEFNSLVAEVTAAWMEKALEMAGGNDARVVFSKKEDADGPYFEFELTWK